MCYIMPSIARCIVPRGTVCCTVLVRCKVCAERFCTVLVRCSTWNSTKSGNFCAFALYWCGVALFWCVCCTVLVRCCTVLVRCSTVLVRCSTVLVRVSGNANGNENENDSYSYRKVRFWLKLLFS